MIAELVLRVPGTPATKGSLKCVGRNGSHRLIESNAGSQAWRETVAAIAADAVAAGRIEFPVEHGTPIGIEITTTISRPASHMRANGSVKDSAPRFPTNLRTGDVDKYARLVLDALEDAAVVEDDAQVIEALSRKFYVGSPDPDALPFPGMVIRVYPYDWIPE
jgi:Holliday junction resolvase RusA-like endonuclease